MAAALKPAAPITAPAAPSPGSALSTRVPRSPAVGKPIPDLPHAVSVSLPRWQDNVDYEEGRLTETMETGYPRFFVHRSIQKLAGKLEAKLGRPGERAFLYPTAAIARRCRAFIQDQLQRAKQDANVEIRIVHYRCTGVATDVTELGSDLAASSKGGRLDVFVVLFPAQHFPLAKAFWQHAGFGISSRFAERCLSYLVELEPAASQPVVDLSSSTHSLSNGSSNDTAEDVTSRQRSYGRNRHYSRQSSSSGANAFSLSSNAGVADRAASVQSTTAKLQSTRISAAASADPATDHDTYVEERYGRNLPIANAELAKCALRRRIAGTLVPGAQVDTSEAPPPCPPAEGDGPTTRKGTGVAESDVYLFPTGMSAIFTAHQVAMEERRRRSQGRVGQSVCFGFPYTDTLKILQKWGPGCVFLGNGRDSDLDDLEARLQAETEPGASDAPTLALFCEFPSNPLLRSPNLARIRALADKHGFLVVVDETIGNFVNVEVLPYADMVVSSLTKIFSGESNVMGGSLVVNPRGPHAKTIHGVMKDLFEDTVWDEDAIFMERNSRDFVRRIRTIDANAQALCKLLHAESQRPDDDADKVIRAIFYPMYETSELYEACRRKESFSPPTAADSSGSAGNSPTLNGSADAHASSTTNGGDAASAADRGEGYGGLFSIFFTSPGRARAFYDALRCHKGPSLGTNFTIASPYAVLAHYTELDWASRFGVDPDLIRVSVGLEEEAALIADFEDALAAAREVPR
ncbi:Cystathionine gamma-synthase [Tilletia horrida]|uniref:Cystathionine gamma-synthase n=1 Tax=Tilletia horrida TaxID=155126 RepID=A0AAN6JKX5_9BASI|nr:Cystathionine gamma-synthase [Tilletia horrida]